MLGSANAPEPGFRPGALGARHVLGGSGMPGPGTRRGVWRALGALAFPDD